MINKKIDTYSNEILNESNFYSYSNTRFASKILSEFMSYRRLVKSDNPCLNSKCQVCTSQYLSKILYSVAKNDPVVFVLPAFPGKSPNENKVLGYLPDQAEVISLKFLEGLCKKIKAFYPPGIKIIICSDGRVFSDVVGMKESYVTEYQIELNKMIKGMSLTDLSTFNLEDYYGDISFTQMRDELMKTYAKPLDLLKYKIKNGARKNAFKDELEANRMYCGITKFLYEDSLIPNQTQSKSSVQKSAKIRAYEVIRRSNAWSELISKHFPKAVRLSIHPQVCGSEKLGIKLVGDYSWMTPWHGVALETDIGYELIKRHEAIKIGADLVYDFAGRPSHYSLVKSSSLGFNL